MRKIPTIFLRPELEHERQYVTEEINPVCQWVFDGEGIATFKYDGVCVMKDGLGRWWARREVKKGGRPPQVFVEVHFDETTGKTMGWEPAKDSPQHKYFRDPLFGKALKEGTYELVGPKINGNPHEYGGVQLISHDHALTLPVYERTFGNLRDIVIRYHDDLTAEGLVFHHPDGRMAKIKYRDFRKDNA